MFKQSIDEIVEEKVSKKKTRGIFASNKGLFRNRKTEKENEKKKD